MNQSSKSYAFGLLLLLLPPLAQALCGLDDPPETLVYTAAYQGVFSAGERWEIARVTLDLAPAPADASPDEPAPERLLLATLTATTAPFRKVDRLFPFRFRYRSWLPPGCEGSRMAVLERDSPDRNRQLLWFDQEAGTVQRFKGEAGKRAPTVLPVQLQQVVVAGKSRVPDYFDGGKVTIPGAQEIFDRLALLYRIRQLPLDPKQPVELAVTDGRRLRGYRVTLEGKEEGADPQLGGSLRVRLDARWSKDDIEEHPTHVWFSDDARRLPLLFRTERAIGAFDVRLQP